MGLTIFSEIGICIAPSIPISSFMPGGAGAIAGIFIVVIGLGGAGVAAIGEEGTLLDGVTILLKSNRLGFRVSSKVEVSFVGSRVPIENFSNISISGSILFLCIY